MRRRMVGSTSFPERLAGAVTAHDLGAVVGCFHDDYRNETPAHPGRGFVGREQVRTNWSRILAGVPDVVATVIRAVEAGGTVWSEWELRGTRRDGESHLMRGVIIFGLEGDRASWARFYLEAVEPGAEGVDGAVTEVVGG
jgi:ketosteroid isomerase-like protein